tara:strand:- start:18523 stop:18825 length:303 start_codon:yes stop_codon:yes gene_type:complete
MNKINYDDKYALMEDKKGNIILAIPINVNIFKINKIQISKDNKILIAGRDKKENKAVGKITIIEDRIIDYLKSKKEIILSIMEEDGEKVLWYNKFDLIIK